MKNDQALVKASDFPLALALLTRVPVDVSCFERGAKAAWAYPLVGLLTGGLAGFAGLTGLWAGLAAPISALTSLFILTITTGAMHEDGLADTADGLWGGWDRARRLEIMKDSHIGTYGVIALLLSFFMSALPQARDHGLSHATGRATLATAALGVGVAAVLAGLLLGWGVVGALVWAAVMTLAMGWLAHAKIGGQTGDILGATQQITEITLLFYLTI
jgi:adenosylcobinamide-GDP ribazoletransferase